MNANSPIRVGTRVYLVNCVAGEPGCIVAFDRKGYAQIYWPDLYDEMGRYTFHHPDSLVPDESFVVKQLDLFEEVAA